MSGICGIIFFNHQPVPGGWLDGMIRTLKHRGSVSIVGQPSVALAQFGLILPPQNKTLLAVADARIDDANTDFLSLYDQHSAGFVQALTGDFALAIWDETQQRLTLGRDHAAARPLYFYHQQGQFVAFASEIKALLVLPVVEKRLNVDKLMRYTVWGSALRPYRSETFYQNIESIPPAYAYTFDVKGSQQHFGWELNLGRFDALKTNADYAQAFKETFVEAVRCRTVSDHAVSAHLSGGLDSSSVAVVARQFLRQPLHTLHFDAGPTADEKLYAEAVLAQGGFAHEYLLPKSNLLNDFQEITRITDRPDIFTVLPSYHLAVARAVQVHGSQTLLTGHDGDSVVGYGLAYPRQLLQQRQWAAFRQTMQNYALVADFESGWTGWNSWSSQKRYELLVHEYLKTELKSLKNRPKAAISLFEQAYRRLGANPLLFLENMGNFFKKIQSKKAPEWALKLEMNYPFDTPKNAHMSDIWHEGMLESAEQHAHLGAHYGHAVAHPFYDRRLVELCLVIPDQLKFDNGYRRGPLRQAMTGLLPESVRLRTSKVAFDGAIREALLRDKSTFVSIFEKSIQKINRSSIAFSDQQHRYLHHRLTVASQQLDNPTIKPYHYLRMFHLAHWLGQW